MTPKPEIRSTVEGQAPALAPKEEQRERRLDVFDAPKRHSKTTYTSDEVTGVCPITGQPDFYEVQISVDDGGDLLIESKSLKLYLQSFSDEGIFCEAFAEKIAADTANAVQSATFVTVTQKPRGGISIKSSAWGIPDPLDPEEANLEHERKEQD